VKGQDVKAPAAPPPEVAAGEVPVSPSLLDLVDRLSSADSPAVREAARGTPKAAPAAATPALQHAPATCPHTAFAGDLHVHRREVFNKVHWLAQVVVRCKQCGSIFLGPQGTEVTTLGVRPPT
jgi:hypothetical protein